MSEVLDLDFKKYHSVLDTTHLTKDSGKVIEVNGLLIKGYLPGATVGSIAEIFPNSASEKSFFAEVVGFKDRAVLMMALGESRGVGLGAKLILKKPTATVRVGEGLLGRVIDGVGVPIDGKGEIEGLREITIYNDVKNPLGREPIHKPLDLGVRAINGLLTVGQGQRVGIMAGSGVGKSVLMGMMARYTSADINVIALIGERGRELREFIEQDLGPEGMKKTILIVATSDQSPLVRMRGAFVATAIAEHFAEAGKNVLLLMDSVTRFAMAQREVGLSVGEPPASKGYTPSVFSTLPKLLERAGAFEGQGSITGLYTVLVEGDDMNDVIGDAVRSIVDGHIVLSRALAQKGQFPAIDVLQSTSRVMRACASPDQVSAAQKFREMLAIYKDAEDLINIGAYKPGSSPKIDRAVKMNDLMIDFLKQKVEEPTDYEETCRSLISLVGA